MPAIFVNGTFPAVDHEAITVSTVATALTSSKLNSATEIGTRGSSQDVLYMNTKRMDEALCTVETNPIRIMFHGSTVTNTTGHKFNPGDSFTLSGYQNLTNLSMIQDSTAAGSATVRVTYFRRG